MVSRSYQALYNPTDLGLPSVRVCKFELEIHVHHFDWYVDLPSGPKVSCSLLINKLCSHWQGYPLTLPKASALDVSVILYMPL